MELEIEPLLPADFVAARDLARARRREADRLRDEAAAAHREAVRILNDRGYTVRDIGTLMDVSPQRVSQLVHG